MAGATNPEISTELQALLALRNMRAKLEALERQRTEPVAIVGIGCRIPGGAVNPEGYWDLLRNRTDAITETPPDRWKAADYFNPDPRAPGKTYCCVGGFIGGIDQFDAVFFGISAAEAARMNPQQRLFLEVAWEALEHAGISPRSLSQSRTGVFAGATMSDYSLLQAKIQTEEDLDAYSITGNNLNAIPGRVSYTLGLQGPSLAIDTACSSSLVAIDRACRSLRDLESDLAIAGGVNINITPDQFISFSKWGMLSRGGRCRTFDASADGFVRSEGCGIVVLKRLSSALAARDRILAVIRGSAVNQDGPSSGFSVPNGLAQEAVIREALANAGVRPEDVSYVEAHGTGTSLGDPIEVEAIGRALAERSQRSTPLAIGSVKTNIGHLEAAAGVAGLIKVVLSLQHRQLPAHLHLSQPNQHIAWERYAIEIPTRLQAWDGVRGKRIAGVSAFGFSGTNVHVILEEAPEAAPAENAIERPIHVMTLSAKNESSLAAMSAAYASRLRAPGADRLAGLCFTANTGRSHFAQRLSVAGESPADLARQLESGEGIVRGTARAHTKPRVAFLFTGQGSQYAGAGRALYDSSPRFRATLDRCAELLRGKLDRGLLEVMFGDEDALQQTGYTQPALFALEYALADLWRSWGVEPAAVIGHSLGEYSAACVAGVFSLEEGLELVAARGRMMQAEPTGGAMAAVFAAAERVRTVADRYEQLSIAAVNTPNNVVISGDEDAVEVARAELLAQGVQSRRLRVSHAFHSRRMDPVLARLEAAAATVRMRAPSLRLISNVTGKAAAAEVAEPRYWARHTRGTVEFSQGMHTLAEMGCQLMLEIGPAPVLTGMGQECLGREGWQWLASLGKNPGSDWKTMTGALQALYAAGVEIDWAGWDADYRRSKVTLPTYPFERQRHWILGSSPKNHRRSYLHPLLGEEQITPLATKQYQAELGANQPEWLASHSIQGRVLMPFTGYLEMARAAGAELFPGSELAFEDVAVPQAMVLQPESARTVQTILESEGEREARWSVYSIGSTGGDWKLHASGRLRSVEAQPAPAENRSLDEIRSRCPRVIEPEEFYLSARQRGLEFGEAFRCVQRIHLGQSEALAEVRLPESLEADAKHYRMHPALLDGCFQAIVPLLNPEGHYLPAGLQSLAFSVASEGSLCAHLKLRGDPSDDVCSCSCEFLSPSGQLLGAASGLRFKRVGALQPASGGETDFYEVNWRSVSMPAGEEPQNGPGRWLILADNGGLGQALTGLLQQRGQECLLHYPASGDPAAIATWVAQNLANSGIPCRGVVHLWGADAPEQPQLSSEELLAFEQTACGSLLAIVQALALNSPDPMPRLWVISRGAQGGVADVKPSRLAGAPLWGFAKTVALEYPTMHCTRVDLSPQAETSEVAGLFQEIWRPDGEDQIAFRNGSRFAARLVYRNSPPAAAPKAEEEQLNLQIVKPGVLEGLELHSAARRVPGPGEVEIRVRAIGLNFRDVLVALGMYPGPEPAIGVECAGVVERVGAGVLDWKPGDELIAFSPRNFGTFAVTRAEFAARKPASMSWIEAATLPVAFLTAAYGLRTLAKLAKGQKVLIHAAAGGVGIAAVQLAQLAGAEVYATAGTDEKRAYLTSIGVDHVFDSRSLAFAKQIREELGDRGIDIVLNSLSGSFIRESLALVAPGGHFLELGKRGILTAEEAASICPGVQYDAFDLAGAASQARQLISGLFAELLPHFETGALRPLPQTPFRLADAPGAFRHMAMAKHIGKVVLVPETHPVAIRNDSSYLITGGLGALGLCVARDLIERGARSLLLTGRRAAAGPDLEAIRQLESRGAQVVYRSCDVASRGQMKTLLEEAVNSMPPLRGVVHAAGVASDHALLNQNWAAFQAVMAPKIQGAWNLHELTRTKDLDFFVMFSSIAAVLGSPGQSNYASANAFLDSLAHYRRAEGLPATTVNWGRWSGAGMASGLAQIPGGHWESAGLGAIEPGAATEALHGVIREGAVQAVVMKLDWGKYLSVVPDSPFLAQLRVHKTIERPSKTNELLAQVGGVPSSQRRALLTELLGKCVIRVLGLPAGFRFDELQPLQELGVDSLTAVELRNRLSDEIGRPLPATLLFDYPTLVTLAAYLSATLGLVDEPVPGSDQPSASFAQVAAMTDAEAEAMLLKELSAGIGS